MDNTTYEFFIRRAWKCERGQKGANTDTWNRLLTEKYYYEESIGTKNEIKQKIIYDKYFFKVKEYINNAYINILKRMAKIKNNEAIVDSVLDLKLEAGNSNTPLLLYGVLKRSLDIINENDL